MKRENAVYKNSGCLHPQNDIAILNKVFSLAPIRYVDIARENRLARIIARWSLLHEFNSRQQENRDPCQ
ncbi:cellulose biosynthesis protein BcsR [Lonsdalea quercina]|uniref:cellulose biosynthesis protein BcsR n=1 Tax=Lonsdalea quercina TaxID=71657 RepID=UPI0009074757|nr:cellulose biosynthesis protein BcsR [Lonsdalea quercina]